MAPATAARDVRRGRRGGRGHGDVVDEAVRPRLARLGRGDERVAGPAGVLPGVPVRRGVAATDVAAAEAGPQVHPRAAVAQAVHAACRLRQHGERGGGMGARGAVRPGVPDDDRRVDDGAICSGRISANACVLARLSLTTSPARNAPSDTLTPTSAVR